MLAGFAQPARGRMGEAGTRLVQIVLRRACPNYGRATGI
jgi:hypothetical protein